MIASAYDRYPHLAVIAHMAGDWYQAHDKPITEEMLAALDEIDLLQAELALLREQS